jgi:hypothetical protein
MTSRRHNHSKAYFKEEQKFRQPWLIIFLILVSILLWIGIIERIFFVHKEVNRPAPDYMIILIWIAFGIGLPIFFFSIKLITEVRNDGIYLRFFPLHRKFKVYPYDEIEKYEVRTYRPIYEYGGWGIRYGFKGRAYNVYGNKGIQLIFKNKKRLLIGSQKAEEFYNAIRKASGSHK